MSQTAPCALFPIFAPDAVTHAWYRTRGVVDLPYPPFGPGADARYEVDETIDLTSVRPMVARPFSVLIGLLGSPTSWRMRGMTAWFGVRGIGSLYYLMYAIQHGLPETLALELMEFHVDVNAIAPGALATRLVDEVLAAGPEKVGAAFYEQNRQWKDKGATPLELGASLAVYLAGAESDGITGRLISAQWDPWKTLHERRDELAKSDIYCLRRIVPEDRGQKWS